MLTILFGISTIFNYASLIIAVALLAISIYDYIKDIPIPHFEGAYAFMKCFYTAAICFNFASLFLSYSNKQVMNRFGDMSTFWLLICVGFLFIPSIISIVNKEGKGASKSLNRMYVKYARASAIMFAISFACSYLLAS
jgi:hypothetical protein